MATKCSACDEKTSEIDYMECSNGNCRKLFHLKCLTLKLEVFETFSEEYKSKWICPECASSNPKRNNQDTPVRGDTPVLNRTFTNNVNTRRGNRIESSLTSNTEVGSDMMAQVLNELRAFRIDVMKRLDTQAKDIQELKLIAEQTEIKVEKLCLDKRVDGEKSNEFIIMKNKIEELKKVQNVTQQETERHLKTFAEVLLQKNTDGVALSNPLTNKVKVNKVGATKSPILVDTQPIEEREEKGNEENDWKVVKNRKSARFSSDVKRGQNTNTITIKATERKKHLHIWRLHPETSAEALSKYVENICGTDVVVEKINHKTKRDYASFRVTVPESVYKKLCQPEVWPVNTEFTEWIWFRKSTNKHKEAI